MCDAAPSHHTSRSPCAGSTRRRWENAPLAREMFVISHLMTRCADRLVEDLGLTCARWRLLGAIASFDSTPMLSDLSCEALLSIQNVSRMIAAMEDDGLVERFSRTGKGRAVFVRATPRGMAVLEQAKERADRFNQVFLDGIKSDEIAQMQLRIDRIIDNLEGLAGDLCTEHDRARGNGSGAAAVRGGRSEGGPHAGPQKGKPG